MADVDAGAEVGEETDADEGDGAAGKKKLIVIAAAALIGALIIGGGVSYMFGMFDGAPARQWAPDSEMSDMEVPPARDVVFYDLPEVTVNLSTTGRATYLKVHISLEVADDDMIDQIEPFLPRVLDAFQVYLRELRPADLEGSAGLFRLKEELLRRINVAVYPARVDGVLFKEILVQ